MLVFVNSISSLERLIKQYMRQKENGKHMISEQLNHTIYQPSLFGVSDFPAKTSPLQENKREFGGGRSGLFWEIIRLLEGRNKEDRPEWLLIENVKNLLSIGRGFDFARLLCSLGEVG